MTFTVTRRDAGTLARAGTLHLPHGEVRTPAFVPLATKGAVRTLEPRDLETLGYELILGNTFHLYLAPGHALVAELGGLHELMRWPRPIITDSGGFQVFSLGHGNVADEIKGRGRPHSGGGVRIEEAGVTFRSPLDGGEHFLAPETAMEIQAALGSDIALVFDECTPFHVTRDYTARSTERTHRWLERCLAWHKRHGPSDQVVYGIVQGGVEPDLRRGSAALVAESRAGGVAIGGSLGRDKSQMHEVVGWTTAELDRRAPQKPRHLLGIGEIDDLVAGVRAGIDTFDCAVPTRLARHGVALVPAPENRWRLDLTKPRHRSDRAPILDGCRCPACGPGFSRAYLHHLLRSGELTALRLITLHNLTFVKAVMDDLRDAIQRDELDAVGAAILAGGATSCSRRSAAGTG